MLHLMSRPNPKEINNASHDPSEKLSSPSIPRLPSKIIQPVQATVSSHVSPSPSPSSIPSQTFTLCPSFRFSVFPSRTSHFFGVALVAPAFFPNRASLATAALACAAAFFDFLALAFSTRPFCIAAFAALLTAILLRLMGDWLC